MSRPIPPGESLFAFLRTWAWPFDETDEDVAKEGSAFALWSREKGHAEQEVLVFRLDEDGVELALNPDHPDRRLRLTPAEVEAIAPALTAYIEGEIGHEQFVKCAQGAAAILAIWQEAWAEASAVSPDEVGGDD